MKYAIRHIGGSEFLSGFESPYGDPIWVEGWDNCDMLIYPTYEDAKKDLIEVEMFFYAEIEELS